MKKTFIMALCAIILLLTFTACSNIEDEDFLSWRDLIDTSNINCCCGSASGSVAPPRITNIEAFYTFGENSRGGVFCMSEMHEDIRSPDPIGIALFARLHDIFNVTHEEFNVSFITLISPTSIRFTTDIGIEIGFTYNPERDNFAERYGYAFISFVFDDVAVWISMPPVPHRELSEGLVNHLVRSGYSESDIELEREYRLNSYIEARAHRDAIFANPAFAPITDLFSDNERVRMRAEQQLAQNVRNNIIFFDSPPARPPLATR